MPIPNEKMLQLLNNLKNSASVSSKDGFIPFSRALILGSSARLKIASGSLETNIIQKS